MEAIRTPKVKICCMQSTAEAEIAIAAGADWIGLVSAMPSGPGPIADEKIRDIARAVRGAVKTVLLTSKKSPREIIDQVDRLKTDVVQIVDALDPGGLETLRRELPSVEIFQVVHVLGALSLKEAHAVAAVADGVLLDSGNPHLAVKELGGTGRIHDWSVSKRIREELEIPVLLAGGLTATNVQSAIAAVGPFGIDVCSGVRTNGLLDRGKLEAFVHAVRASP